MQSATLRSLPDGPSRAAELATRESHYRILAYAYLHGGEATAQQAAATNRSSRQAVVTPLRELEEAGLLLRQRDGRRDVFRLTTDGERHLLSAAGRPSEDGGWVALVAIRDANPDIIRSAIAQTGARTYDCAGTGDFLVLLPSHDLLLDLMRRLRRKGAAVTSGALR